MNDLLTAQLAIYAVLCIPVLYLWVTHMPTGILGWGMLFAFCSLRVVGGAMATGSHPSSTALIISSIGISPLLLTVDGILHEAQVYRNPRMSKCLEWTFLTFIHVLVATGVAMVGVGASALTGKNPTPNDFTLLKVGMALLESCWVFLCIAAVVALMPSRSDSAAATYSQGTKLLWAVLLALPFIGVRVTYGLVAEYTQKTSLNPITGDLAIRVILSFLAELIAVLIFIVAGFQTRKRRTHRGDRPVRHRSPRKPVTHV